MLEALFRRFEEAREKEGESGRRRCEPNPWLEHTMWESHIGPYKAWAIQMTKPDGVVVRVVTKQYLNGLFGSFDYFGPNKQTEFLQSVKQTISCVCLLV